MNFLLHDAVQTIRSEGLNDQVYTAQYRDLSDRVTSPSVRSIAEQLNNMTAGLAAGIVMSDMSGGNGFSAVTGLLSPKVSGRTPEEYRARLDSAAERLLSCAKALTDQKSTDKDIAQLFDSAADSYVSLANKIKQQSTAVGAEGSLVDSIELGPIDYGYVSCLTDSFQAELGDIYTVTKGETSLRFNSNQFQPGNVGQPASLPMALLQTYYRMLTVMVARPIMTKPAIFTEELVERIVVPQEVLENDVQMIQYLELSDQDFPVKDEAADPGRNMPLTSILGKQSKENSRFWIKSTVSLQVPTSDFGKYINRLNFIRALRIMKTTLIMNVEQTVRDFIMTGIKSDIKGGTIGDVAGLRVQGVEIANGDVAFSAMGDGANAKPGVLALTGIGLNGLPNNTLSEIDLGKILSALDMNDSGNHITHMLVHPQAIQTIFHSFREQGLFKRTVDSNASLLDPIFNNNDITQFAMGGMGAGKWTDPTQSPFLYGPVGAPKSGVLQRLINGLNPATGDLNLETALHKRFFVKVGPYEIMILPYSDAPVYTGGTIINNRLSMSPMIAVNGRCTTDIYLYNANRTAVMVTTGPVQKRTMTDRYAEFLCVAYEERFKVYVKPHHTVYKICNVRIDTDRGHRAWIVRR